MLFVDRCHAEVTGARFANGYQKGNLQSERRHLHAWLEVYRPRAAIRRCVQSRHRVRIECNETKDAGSQPLGNFLKCGLVWRSLQPISKIEKRFWWRLEKDLALGRQLYGRVRVSFPLCGYGQLSTSDTAFHHNVDGPTRKTERDI